MNTAIKCCCMSTESQFLIRKVSNYCSLLFLMLAFTANSWFIQNTSAQQPSGTLVLVAPSKDPAPNEDFVVSVEIVNPQNVTVFTMSIEYPDVLDLNSRSDITPAEGQFDIDDLGFRDERMVDGREDRVSRELVLGINYDMGEPVFFSEGVLFTIEFEASEKGNHQISIVESTHLQDGGSTTTQLENNELPSVIVSVRGPLQGTVNLAPSIGDVRVGETSFIDIELHDRSRAYNYEITVDPSANLGPLTVSYNSDDTNGTAITNHTAGDAITLSADTWLPNEPLDNIIDWRVTLTDPIVATVFFTPITTGEGSFEITAAKIFDPDNPALTLSNPDTLTFTIAEARQHVTQPNTGVGPTPIIEVEGGTQDGPFEIKIYFVSENHIGQPINADASIRFPRGVYGFARDEIEVGGTAGASVTTRLWEADSAQLYYARINPTETGARTVTLQVPAGVVREVGTNLPNVASEIVTVSTNLVNPPWDVTNNGSMEEADAEAVEAALGQGMEENGPDFAFYRNTIADPRTDVNGDLYVNQVDIDLVRMHIPDDGGAQGETGNTRQARSPEAPPDASVWMPDANLRAAMRNKLNISDDTELTQGRMTDFSNLTIENKGINDITGLEYATNLKKLELRNNRISDITPLTGLTQLTELKVGENNISDITALAGLIKLTHVGLAENEITDITALANLTTLKELWLRQNSISDITTLRNLTKLTRLNLEKNEVSDIAALANLTKLTYLNLKNNEVSDITALGNLTKLTYLNLRYNEVNDITALGNLTKLTELWMADNNISDVSPLSSLTKLKKLGLANNPILDTSPLYSLTQGALKNVDITVSQYPPWDVNEDGSVDATDSSLVTAALGQTGADIADPRTDVNGDGTVDQDDLTLVTDNIDADGNAPSNSDIFTLLDQESLEALDPEVLETYLITLRAESDGSSKYQKAIAILEALLATIIPPKQTRLLANYPNPFNPETWIPYHLANPSTVRITIYNPQGVIIRRLDLGHQQSGYYTHRSRAAYWDGRNAFGERVASGIYFYQFQGDNISSVRKLLILK